MCSQVSKNVFAAKLIFLTKLLKSQVKRKCFKIENFGFFLPRIEINFESDFGQKVKFGEKKVRPTENSFLFRFSLWGNSVAGLS